jgi:hypothetical protein
LSFCVEVAEVIVVPDEPAACVRVESVVVLVLEKSFAEGVVVEGVFLAAVCDDDGLLCSLTGR